MKSYRYYQCLWYAYGWLDAVKGSDINCLAQRFAEDEERMDAKFDAGEITHRLSIQDAWREFWEIHKHDV